MRKFIALGLGVATAGMLAIGPASPAQAVISPPNSVVTQVCNGLPAQITAILNTIIADTSAVTAAQTNLATKSASFATSQTNLVAALISFLQAVDAGGSVDAQQAMVSARMSEYGDQAVLWGNAWNALKAAELNATVNGMTSTVLNGLNAGLCV
jgi:hypothetical protein